MPIDWDLINSMGPELEMNLLLRKLHTRTYCARRRAKRGHGTSYTVDHTELEILQDPSINQSSPLWRPYYTRAVHMQRAYARLQTPAADTPETRAAAARIGAFVSSDAPVKWDLAIKIFNDYDMVLFHGDLRRRIYIRWLPFNQIPALVAVGHELGAIGLTQPQHTSEMNIPRITITLRADVDWTIMKRLAILGVMVHEMLHAFMIIHCSVEGSIEQPVPGIHSDMHHGPIWTAAAKFFERKTGLQLVGDWTDWIPGLQ